ncbi:MAG: DUF2268 domain-containing putative Zn-dependent protease, partial [Vicinamibacteria bacterium]
TLPKNPLCASSVSKLALGLLLTAGCNTPSDPADSDTGEAIGLEGGFSLVFEDGGILDSHKATIEPVVRETISAVRELLSVNGVTIRVTVGTAFVIPEIGMGGRTNGPGEIQLVMSPDSAVLAQSLTTELFPLLAHEMHHVMRIRTAGFGSNLLEAMVTEGLADQFSIEVAAIEPPIWSRALSEDELQIWYAQAREHWFDESYNHDAWFFGTTGEIPRWAGYSIGFELTRLFLRANPGRRPSQLFGEPAASFIPADAGG